MKEDFFSYVYKGVADRHTLITLYHIHTYTMKNVTKLSTIAIASLFAVGVIGGTTVGAFNAGSAGKVNMHQGQKKGMKHQFMQSIDKAMEFTDNGVIITMTTDDETALERLQNFTEKAGAHLPEGVEVETELLENGVRITKTGVPEDMLEKMKNHEEREEMRESIERNVENLENGIRIQITSSDAKVVDFIQNKEAPEGHTPPENVTISKENIENGVQVEVTSEDSEVVERLQQGGGFLGKKERKGGHNMGRGEGEMKGKRKGHHQVPAENN